ncbi:MAG: Asp-tRNA(Asn)/Glu-tRNA(Gln) amidotransferase subunit GatB [Clostridiales bacterium]|nr:Asp-tRNA(Asn)/Glu-tRNA(Gln) amidotransferase subunit GatB [Clostridiales bacterium]
MTKYETVIGLEFHAELKTKSKIFCGCPTSFSNEPNINICPGCLGLPGALPVLNKRVVELAVKAGLALNCEIQPFSQFDRKNYFYPDLPAGYQTTQLPLPICRNGHIFITGSDGEEKKVRINRIHIEEDAGKLVHSGESISGSRYSLPDYNRSSMPLIEIVTEPDLCSADEAKQFAEKLKLILEYAGVSDVKMEQGSLRCDVNISLKPEGQKELGVRSEIKNLNSFRSVHRAILYEQSRHMRMLNSGGQLVQETRLWDEAEGKTQAMRTKEDAHDYRYFPEPNVPPVVVDKEWLAQIAAELPELPDARSARLLSQHALSDKDVAQLVADPLLAGYFDELVALFPEAKTVTNWLLGDVTRLLNNMDEEAENIPVSSVDFAALLTEVKNGAINNNSAKEVLEIMFTEGGKPEDIISARGFAQISDSTMLEDAIKRVISANMGAADDYRNGRIQAIGFLVGQVMKETKGQANPGLVKELLEKTLAHFTHQGV